MEKNFFRIVFVAALIFIFSAGNVFAQTNENPEVKIDYGNSKIFSRAEMDFCIDIIKYELKRSGCTLHSVRYAGDKFDSHKNRTYLNSLAKSRGFKKKFRKCMVFYSDYRSPPDDGKISAWNYDSEYTDWQWWFGFYKEDGEWKLLTSGY